MGARAAAGSYHSHREMRSPFSPNAFESPLPTDKKATVPRLISRYCADRRWDCLTTAWKFGMSRTHVSDLTDGNQPH